MNVSNIKESWTTEKFLKIDRKKGNVFNICPHSSILSIRGQPFEIRINGHKIQIIVNTRRPGNQFNIFTSLLTLTFPSLSYCLLFVPPIDEPKKAGRRTSCVPGENVRGKKLRGVYPTRYLESMKNYNLWSLCGNEKVPRGCVYKYCRSWMIQKESRIASNDDFFFFHHLLLLLLRFIKGMPKVRSRGSKVQKNCAFIREDDARSIFILKFTSFRSNRFLAPYIFHAYLTLASFFSTPPPLFKSVFVNYIFLIASSISICSSFFLFSFFLVFK